LSNILYPYNHARSNWPAREWLAAQAYPPLDLTDDELHERLMLIDPIDMSNVLLRADTAFNPATSVRLLELLGRDEAYLVRYFVTQNPSAPAELVEQIRPTLSKYMLTEAFRGWRDLYKIRGAIGPERALRLLVLPESYPGGRHGSAWLIQRLPRGYDLPRETLVSWLDGRPFRMHRQLISRDDLLGPHDLWAFFVETASPEMRKKVQFDKRVPPEARAFAAFMTHDLGSAHGH
jgi:hypothetical protein